VVAVRQFSINDRAGALHRNFKTFMSDCIEHEQGQLAGCKGLCMFYSMTSAI
jgi:hypothetical protein